MTATGDRRFALEIHPEGWQFPAGKTWIAGWIRPDGGQVITDVRARLHHRVILGLCGLPHPAFEENSTGQPHSPGPGFSFLFAPHPGATLLRLEARDKAGQWSEFFRTKISAVPNSMALSDAPSLVQSLGTLATDLLRRRRRSPGLSWSAASDELLAAFVSEPLDVLPEPPFIGALEEPHDFGRLRYGLISVTGWLAHSNARITRLSAVIDPLPETAVPYGLPRKDVPGVFSSFERNVESGFVGEIALPANLASPVLIKIFAELESGESHLVFARRFTPRFHGATPAMPPLVTAPEFARAVWALHQSAGRHALPRTGLMKAACGIWARHRSVPSYRPRKSVPRHWNPRAGDDPSGGLHDVVKSGLSASTVIAPADDMVASDRAQYFQIGREALALVRKAVALSGCKRVGEILDLPCGHGRVARWLRSEFAETRLTVCDTQGPGVAFCAEHFNATGVQAASDGSHWNALTGPYDVIWCGSLLTHFDRDEWLAHLNKLAERLSARGVLVFTSHGLFALDKLQTGEIDYGLPPSKVDKLRQAGVKDGFGYVDYTDQGGYGVSVAQPGWVCELIDRETELRVLHIFSAAWDQHQDVFVCMRGAPPRKN